MEQVEKNERLSDREVGERLGISERTANRERRKIQKLWEEGARQVALVDDEDYERLSRYRWFASQDSKKGGLETSKPGYYAKRKALTASKETTVMRHREIIGFPLGDVRVPRAHPEARPLGGGV